MRCFLAILIFSTGMTFLVPADRCLGMDAILGTVVSVRSEAGEVVLRVLVPAGGHEPGDSVVLRLPRSQEIEGRGNLLRPGATLRVWGDFLADSPGAFEVRSFRGGTRGKDPTGVRSRLGRGGGSGRRGGYGGRR